MWTQCTQPCATGRPWRRWAAPVLAVCLSHPLAVWYDVIVHPLPGGGGQRGPSTFAVVWAASNSPAHQKCPLYGVSVKEVQKPACQLQWRPIMPPSVLKRKIKCQKSKPKEFKRLSLKTPNSLLNPLTQCGCVSPVVNPHSADSEVWHESWGVWWV